MSYQIRPIGPGDVKKSIPEFVIESVNELINEKYNGSSFVIRLKEVKERVKSKTEQDIDSSWMDFEPLYRDMGWRVEYDQPTYGDNHFEAFYRFSPK